MNKADPTEIEPIDESSSWEMREPFDPTTIDITPRPLIIDSLIQRMKSTPMRIGFCQGDASGLGDLW